MPIPCKHCPHCETCSPTNIGAVCKPIPAMQVYAESVEQDRLFAQHMMKTMTPEQINRFCFENGFSVPEPKKKWVVKYSALFAAGGQPSGQFNVSAADEQEARSKAHQVMKAISKEHGVDSFNLNISDDVVPEPKVRTIIRRTHWTSGLVTDREMDMPLGFQTDFINEQRRRYKNGPGIKSVELKYSTGRVFMIFAERNVSTNPLLFAPYGKSAIHPVGTKCTTEEALRTGHTIHKMVQALQDGECPCCHGSWPSPDATACNGCGYRLDEE